MRLSGTEKWEEGRIEAALAFSGNLPSSSIAVRKLLDERPYRAGRFVAAQSGSTDILYRRGDAAALAFTTGRLSTGLSIAASLWNLETKLTMMQRIFAATLGTLAGTVDVQLVGEGRVVAVYEAQPHFLLSLSEHTLVNRRRMADLVIPAAFASLRRRLKIGRLGDGFTQDFRFSVSDPFTRFSLFGQAFTGSEQAPNLLTLFLIERLLEYENYIGMLQANEESWAKMEFRGSLVDWPLLAMLVGLHRAYDIPRDSDLTFGRGTHFLHELSRAIPVERRVEA